MGIRSTLENCDPVAKLLWVINTSVVAAVMRAPIELLLLCGLLVVSLLLLSRVDLSRFIKYWKILLFVPFFLFFFHLFLTPGTVIWRFSFVSVSAEGLREASVHSLRLFCSVLALVIFLLTTDIKSLIIRLIDLGVPISFAFAIYLMLRFIPIMSVEAETIFMALRTRAPKRIWTYSWLRLWFRYLFALVLLGIRRAEQTALAMDARGFELNQFWTSFAPFAHIPTRRIRAAPSEHSSTKPKSGALHPAPLNS